MTSPPAPGIEYRRARPTDAPAIHRLVRDSGGLDLNSLYMYALFADRFGETCAVAERGGKVVGFVVGFVPPRSQRTLFVWQIGVDGVARGQGVGAGLLRCVVRSPACADIRYVEATVTPKNAPSRALFTGFARQAGAPLAWGAGYGEECFGTTPHDPEELLRIGPFDPEEVST